jgi:3'-phosphoadenosine 5'-phosphosulfate sulfotransferase (PAPS reductase)/FAD synthetase
MMQKINSETIISFSGGRTSGMMLKMILDAHDGLLPDHVKVVFANTGKEMPQTLDFVNQCSRMWNVPIVWLEFRPSETPQDRWQEITFQKASRKGEPFDALIEQKDYLPNPTMRFCTIELKIRVIKFYAQQALGWKNWDMAIGFRADEPSRVAKLSIPSREPFERYAPLAALNITADDVGKFWKEQLFDLDLPNINGKTMHGNCDLCFLKGAGQTLSLVSENPSLADWWIAQESRPLTEIASERMTGRFRKDRPSYAEIKAMALNHDDMFGYEDHVLADCGCTD